MLHAHPLSSFFVLVVSKTKHTRTSIPRNEHYVWEQSFGCGGLGVNKYVLFAG
jgi:hypothetical protein